MKKNIKTALLAVILLFILSGMIVTAEGVSNVLSIETGYSYTSSSRDIDIDSPHGFTGALYYGYTIHQKPASMTVLSLVAGYNRTPFNSSSQTISGIVYGLEYTHMYFTDRTIALLAGYGLQFNQVRQSNLDGYAYGHHTKLTIGGIYSLNENHKLGGTINYNFVSFPYFEQSEAKQIFPSLSIRYFYHM
jgi:hypothetical protein